MPSQSRTTIPIPVPSASSPSQPSFLGYRSIMQEIPVNPKFHRNRVRHLFENVTIADLHVSSTNW